MMQWSALEARQNYVLISVSFELVEFQSAYVYNGRKIPPSTSLIINDRMCIKTLALGLEIWLSGLLSWLRALDSVCSTKYNQGKKKPSPQMKQNNQENPLKTWSSFLMKQVLIFFLFSVF